MHIDLETVSKIAHLARLEFEEDEAKNLVSDLNKILDWMDKLNEVDTSNVEPLRHMSVEEDVYREDVIEPHLEHARALKNAPKKDSDYIRVPKVIE